MMNKFNTMFKKDNTQSVEERETEKAINMTGDIARMCLSTTQFKLYKEQYTKAEGKVLKSLLVLTDRHISGEISQETYAVRTLVYMTRLKNIRMLLATVTSDARKGKTNE